MIETVRALTAEAAAFLDGRIRRTPVEYSPKLSAALEVTTWIKLESLQLTGSFKIRGAWYRLWKEQAQKILTCSAGNHGKGVAYAARELGKTAVICVPKSVDQAKYRGMVERGAEVLVSPYMGYDETEDWAIDLAAREGLPFVSPFDDLQIMAGNGGTLAKETLEQLPDVEACVLPVGGGGLAAGFAAWAQDRQIIGCQHEQSPGLPASLAAGNAVTRLPAIETLAGGVEGGLGKKPFEILKTRVNAVALVSEEEILDAVRWMLSEHQYLIEPTAAVTVAACLAGKTGSLKGPAVVLVCGRNVSREGIQRILC